MRSSFVPMAMLSLLLSARFAAAQSPERAAEPSPPTGANAEPARPDTPPARPKLALVLSGGGARGAAHIGVLKVLEQLHIVPDLIVGTSMGSIVGGLYATGWSAEEIETFLKSLDWNQVFTDKVPRSDMSFRRKQDDWIYLIQAKLRFKKLKPYLPPGLLGGQRLELMLKSLEFESTGREDFDRFAIPYRAVAADIITGETVVIGHGNLATAMRASMSISGAFAPVEFEGHKLVDGGAVANLPVGIAQQLGATRIIAVDISSPLDSKEQLGSFVSILNQMSGLLTVGNVEQDRRRLGPDDVFIHPDLGDIKFSDFKRAVEAIEIGEAAARQQFGRLRGFAGSDAAWTDFLRRRAELPPSDLTVERIDIRNTSWVADEVVRRRLELTGGQKLDDIGMSKAVMKLHALDYFGLIRPDFARTGPNTGVLTLDTPPKPYGRNILQLGLSLQADRSDGKHSDSAFTLTARHQMLAVNSRGGELQNVIEFGQTNALVSELYQPLDYGMRWFVDPRVSFRQSTLKLWSDGQPVVSYGVNDNDVSVGIGRVFEHWGSLQLRPFWAYSRADLNIGDPLFPPFAEHDGGVALRLSADTRDSVMFPEHGTFAAAQYTWTLSDLGADTPGRQAAISASKAFSFGKNTVRLAAESVMSFDTPVSFRSTYFMGGTLRLSGLGEKELFGDRGALARVVYYRKVTSLDLGPLSARVYGGMSLETGGTYGQGEPFTWNTLRYAGSIFAGAATPLGPAYLGWGWADHGRNRFFLVIGREF